MPTPMVGLSGRVLFKDVGGNTRYVRNIYQGPSGSGSSDVLFRPMVVANWFGEGRGRSVGYAIAEGLIWPTVPPRQVDLLHFPADTGAILPSRVPIVTTVHGMASLHMDHVRNAAAEATWRTRVGVAIHRSDAIITVSQTSADDLIRHFGVTASKVTVIPHGVDAQFHPLSDTGNGDASKAQVLPDRYFLYVGNLDPRKNIDGLVAAAETQYAQTRIPLVIIGSHAWGSRRIMAHIRDADSVMHLGRQSDDFIVNAMQHAVAFVFPSRYEGFGLPVLEAMACGTPVICSTRGALRELASGYAHIINGIDHTSIAGAMVELARDNSRRRQLRLLGLERAQAYSWSQARAAHRSLFEGVLR